MSDIADKIYAATGLTLNAEAAAKLGQMIQAENARLLEVLSECNSWLTAAIECKNWTWDWDQKEAAIFARDQARAALGEKDDAKV
jgi:hypothetical protein